VNVCRLARPKLNEFSPRASTNQNFLKEEAAVGVQEKIN